MGMFDEVGHALAEHASGPANESHQPACAVLLRPPLRLAQPLLPQPRAPLALTFGCGIRIAARLDVDDADNPRRLQVPLTGRVLDGLPVISPNLCDLFADSVVCVFRKLASDGHATVIMSGVWDPTGVEFGHTQTYHEALVAPDAQG